MPSTTPPVPPPEHARNASTTSATQGRPRSRSRGATPPPLPTTPLRPPSRSSLRSSQTPRHHYSASTGSLGASGGRDNAGNGAGAGAGAGARIVLPLDDLEPAFADLADGMADLEANFMHLQLMHESLARFSEAFAAFLYGLGVNAFCADFPEQPTEESFRRARENPAMQQTDDGSMGGLMGANDSALDPDHTFLTTDTSFVDNPPSTVRKSPAAPRYGKQPTTRGGTTRGGPTTGTRGARGGGVPRGTNGRGRASGLARASTRGRGVYR